MHSSVNIIVCLLYQFVFSFHITNDSYSNLYYRVGRLDDLIVLHQSIMTGVSKLQPTGQMKPAKPFHPAREAILSMVKKIMFMKTLLF